MEKKIVVDGTKKTEIHKILCNVTSSGLNIKERGVLVLDLYCDLPTWGSLSVFNMVLDTYDKEKERRVGTAFGCEMIRQTLEFFGVNNLHEIKNYKCYLLSTKETIWSSSDVIGIEQLPFNEYKDLRQQIIKQDVIDEFLKPTT